MFYSHQLLARKAPLGQIWMAATMHAKIHRRKLNKLNIIKVCEEILNPSVPMALRLSGILMGGVVIVYDRKVKLLYDDAIRLQVQLIEAWKVKSAPSDPTRLPKGKAQAKFESVTLPPNGNEDLGEIEESLPYSNTATITDFQQTYFAMRLDNLDVSYLNQNLQGDQEQNHHQAEAANITLNDNYDSYQADTTTSNHFESSISLTPAPKVLTLQPLTRFDIEGDEETQLNFPPAEHTGIPSIIPSPPRQEELPKSDEVWEQHHEEQVKQQSAERKEANLDKKRKKIGQRRARRPGAFAMDYDQTIITGHMYQYWLQNSSDIIRERKRKRPRDALSLMNIGTLMELPSVVFVEKLFTNGLGQVHYPAPLMEVWKRSIEPPQDSPSAGDCRPQPPEPSSSSPPARDPYEVFDNGVVSPPTRISIEKQRANTQNNEMHPEVLINELRNNLKSNGFGVNGLSASKVNLMATPANSGDEIRSLPSSGSGHGFFSHNSDANSGRSSKKRPFSASKNSGNGLEPVAEDLSWEHSDPNFKLAKLSKNELTPDLMVETGPTQTQKHPVINQPIDHITDSIRMHLKSHFDTPGYAKVESLNQLAFGMNAKRAACLFYQTCVLATRDYIRVEQKLPYGDILISRGPKM